MDPQKITELANLLRNNGDKILNSEFTLTLSGTLLRALNDSFTLIADNIDIGAANQQQQNFEVVKPINTHSNVFRDLQLIHDFVQKTTLLCIKHYPCESYYEGVIDITKFHELKRLEIQKTNVKQIIGIQRLRSQLQQLICVKSLENVQELITRCGGDNSNGFVWNELKVADFSYNNLQTVDTSLEFAQYLQHLNLRHNKLRSVEAIKWLPHLKTLDLSYNCLQCIPQFHMEACKRLQVLNMSNNLVEDLLGIAKLDALTDLDLSDNYLLEHSYLLPLSVIVTLKSLNLYGNPLHCHPKHRLATAQFLHKNTATVKFVLDFETLSQKEKALTGTQILRHIGALNTYTTRTSTSSISCSSNGRLTYTTNTPASSIGSLRSFKFQENGDGEHETQSAKKRSVKVRTVNIADTENEISLKDANENPTKKQYISNEISKFLQEEQDNSGAHLETKKQIQTLREKFGAEWLQTGNAEMVHSVLGIETQQCTNEQREQSRQLFNDYLGMYAADHYVKEDSRNLTSTPTSDSKIMTEMDLTNISTTAANETTETIYHSINSDESAAIQNNIDDEPAHLKNVYGNSNANNEQEQKPEDSETEDDEDCYIVYNTHNLSEPIFFTISSNFLREKDTLTQRTKTKWGIKILESCERVKANTLSINFDTIKKDKKERIYVVAEDLCLELEKKLRHILSQRDLSAMNIILYRCVNCGSQFTREERQTHYESEVRCPDCQSTFVAEIEDARDDKENQIVASVNSVDEQASPPADATVAEEAIAIGEEKSDSNSIVASTRLSAINNSTPKPWMQNTKSSANSLNESSSCSKITNSESSFDSNQSVVGSSNTERDLEVRTNYESDIDIISNPSQSSIEVLEQYNNNNASRKSSMDRRLSYSYDMPALLHDEEQKVYAKSFIEREFRHLKKLKKDKQEIVTQAESTTHLLEPSATQATTSKANVTEEVVVTTSVPNTILTESSSSGSVTDSVCTAYEQIADKELHQHSNIKKDEQMLNNNTNNIKKDETVVNNSNKKMSKHSKKNSKQKESKRNAMSAVVAVVPNTIAASSAVAPDTVAATTSVAISKKDDASFSSMFGALFQSTNILLSKKVIDANISDRLITTNNEQQSIANPSTIDNVQAYKFNYNDFNDIDHRLKLYFYQTKFEEAGEHFKWLVRGRIYNEQTQTLCDGIIVLTTCKCYVMEVYAAEQDDVAKWLRQIVSVTMDRLNCVQLLPWKIGLAFQIRDWGGLLLLLQDILRTDSLLLYFANSNLPTQCKLIYQPSVRIINALNAAVMDEPLNMCALLTSFEVVCDNAKRNFSMCTLLATDNRLYISSSKLTWLSLLHNETTTATTAENDLELCLTQFMNNLVDVEHPKKNIYIINFLDDTQNKTEIWKLYFETEENAESSLNAIGQSWQKLFGVPLLNT